MKESLIGLYVDNAEVPEYKSAGASGFDLRVKFSNKVARLSAAELHDLINGFGQEVLKYLYHSTYESKYFVIDYDRFKNSVLYAIKIAIGGGAGIDDFLNHLEQNHIDKVNIILPYTVNKFETGIYVEIPEEDEMQIRPRSGISSSTLMSVKLGTIDTDYRGNIGIIVQNPTPFSYIIIPNSRLAQGVIVEKKRAVFDIKSSKDELSKTERGENGFGKSGLM